MESGIKMTPVAREYIESAQRGKYHRGKYRKAIEQFAESGAEVMLIDDGETKKYTTYLGLRRAVNILNLDQAVYVQMVNGNVTLVRIG